MNENLMKLKIITPLKEEDIDSVKALKILTDNGEVEILPFHNDYMANVEISVLELKLEDERTLSYAVGGGLIHFIESLNEAHLIVPNFISVDSLDEETRKKAEELALNKLKSAKSRLEHRKAELNLKRALSDIRNKE